VVVAFQQVAGRVREYAHSRLHPVAARIADKGGEAAQALDGLLRHPLGAGGRRSQGGVDGDVVGLSTLGEGGVIAVHEDPRGLAQHPVRGVGHAAGAGGTARPDATRHREKVARLDDAARKADHILRPRAALGRVREVHACFRHAGGSQAKQELLQDACVHLEILRPLRGQSGEGDLVAQAVLQVAKSGGHGRLDRDALRERGRDARADFGALAPARDRGGHVQPGGLVQVGARVDEKVRHHPLVRLPALDQHGAGAEFLEELGRSKALLPRARAQPRQGLRFLQVERDDRGLPAQASQRDAGVIDRQRSSGGGVEARVDDDRHARVANKAMNHFQRARTRDESDFDGAYRGEPRNGLEAGRDGIRRVGFDAVGAVGFLRHQSRGNHGSLDALRVQNGDVVRNARPPGGVDASHHQRPYRPQPSTRRLSFYAWEEKAAQATRTFAYMVVPPEPRAWNPESPPPRRGATLKRCAGSGRHVAADPRGDATVRAWLWQLVRAEVAPRVSEEHWSAWAQEAGVILPAVASPDARLPARAFDHVLRRSAERLGGTYETEAHELGRRVAHRWGAQYAPAVQQHEGRPLDLIRLFLATIHPHMVDPAGSRIEATGDAQASLRLDDPLPPPFRAGILRGLVDLSGAEADVVAAGRASYALAWRLPRGSRPPGWGALLTDVVRPSFLVATLVPVLVALALAAGDGPLHVGLAILTLLGVMLFQVGSSAINDYYDHLSGADRENRRPGAAERLGPSRLRVLAYALYAAGTLVGLALVAARGVEVLWLGLAGFCLGFLYSAPPLRLAYRGLGELALAVGFGPLIVMGTYFVQRQAWSLPALWASIPVAILMALVLYINEFPDREGDARVGKRTLIVRLPERPAVILYVLLLALTYLLILGGVALANVPSLAAYAFPPYTLLGLLTLPLATRTAIVLARNYPYPYRLVPANARAARLHVATGLLFAVGHLLALMP
jgi:1,4-dihydroxy-2-naphthoate polyprenyltransferase